MNHRKRNKVSIISRESNTKTLDIRLLEEELLRRGVRVETLTRLLTKERSVKSLGYLGHLAKQIVSIAGSGVVVLDTYCIPISMLPHHKGLKTIQMWHALSAVKKFGWQTVGKEDGSSLKTARLMKMHEGYDYVACASDITARHFCEAFNVPEDKIVKLGLPRIDYIRSVTSGEGKEKTAAAVYAEYPQLRDSGRKVVLYAPTFHKGKPADVRGLVDALDPQRYTVIVKLHPIDKAAGETVEAENVIYDQKFMSYDLLSVADAVVSDYSSLVVESTLSEVPLYLYVYDIDSYSRTTGLNVDFDEEPISSYVFRKAEPLAAALEQPYDFDALHAFRDRYIDIDTADCTAALADFIESLL